MELVNDYTECNPALAPFFAEQWRDLLASPPAPARLSPALISEVNAFQAVVGGQGRLTGDQAIIVTGQQPGVFIGPLYTVYKAATAVLLARALEKRFGIPTVPVFWLGSDDHDFEEVSTAVILDRDHALEKLIWEPQEPVAGRPIHAIPPDDHLRALVMRASQATISSELAGEVTDFLMGSLNESESLADWTARVMARLFRNTPLVFFAPHTPGIRRLVAPIYARAIAEPLEASRLVNEAGENLEDAGYTRQVKKGADEAAFFVEQDKRRRKVLFKDGVFHLPETGGLFTPAEMNILLAEHPELFSANVTLRPIVQQHLLSPAAYVAGPGEIAYWAQMRGVFDAHGLPMPVVYPRLHAILTSMKLKKLLRQTNLKIPDLSAPLESLVDRILRMQPPDAGLLAVEQSRVAIQAELNKLQDALILRTPHLKEMPVSLALTLTDGMNRIERALLHADASRVETATTRATRLRNTFLPLDKPQERVLTICSWLFEHGWGVMDRIMADLTLDSGKDNEVEL